VSISKFGAAIMNLCTSAPSVGNSLQPSEAFTVLNLSQPAIANAVLNSTAFFQLLHNKKFKFVRFAHWTALRAAI
jgi:hypothetical protein